MTLQNQKKRICKSFKYLGKIIARRLISFKIKEDVKIVKAIKSEEVVIIRTQADNPDNNEKLQLIGTLEL